MRIKWAPVEAICGEVEVTAAGRIHCWVENLAAEVKAGSRPKDPSDVYRRSLWFDMEEVITACISGRGRERWGRLLATEVRRALDHQATVHDMAEATARLWRQTNALMRMASSTHVAMDPGRVVADVLATMSRSTQFLEGAGLVRLPGGNVYVAYRASGEARVEAATMAALETVGDEVRVVSEDEEAELHAACVLVSGHDGPVAVARLTSEKEQFGFVVASIPEHAEVTSEDLKMLGAAARILSIEVENRYTLRREREAARLEVENELLAAQARDMEEMVQVVAHDLRSPMTSMYGFMHVALDETAELHSLLEEQGHGPAARNTRRIAEPLEDGVRSVEKLNRMVQRLLDFSRAARTPYSFERLDIEDLARGVVRSMNYQLERKSIEVEIGELPAVTGDRVQLEAVFGNLVDNAIKYMGTGSFRRISVGSERRDGGVVYFVGDTGMGMTSAESSKAFLPFRRFHPDTVPGEGIGLPYVRKIVERHDGRIWCESKMGKGSTFYFTLGRSATVASTQERGRKQRGSQRRTP